MSKTKIKKIASMSPVIWGGLGTGFNVLLIIFLIALKKPDFMGILIFPSFIIGVLSGLGYALLAFRFNKQVNARFILFPLIFSAVLYLLFHLALYEALKNRLSIENFKFFLIHQYDNWKPLIKGNLKGITLKGLETAQFLLGALTPSLIMLGKNWCNRCKCYMESMRSYYLHSDLSLDKIVRLGKEQRIKQINNAIEDLEKDFRVIERKLSTTGIAQLFKDLEDKKVKLSHKIAYIKITLFLCTDCKNFIVHSTLFFLDEELRWKRDEMRLFTT